MQEMIRQAQNTKRENLAKHKWLSMLSEVGSPNKWVSAVTAFPTFQNLRFLGFSGNEDESCGCNWRASPVCWASLSAHEAIAMCDKSAPIWANTSSEYTRWYSLQSEAKPSGITPYECNTRHTKIRILLQMDINCKRLLLTSGNSDLSKKRTSCFQNEWTNWKSFNTLTNIYIAFQKYYTNGYLKVEIW